MYEQKVKYTVNYYKEKEFSDKPVFLHAESQDKPTKLDDLWKISDARPVLEEIQEVTLNENFNDSDWRDPFFEPNSRKRNAKKFKKLEPGDKIGESVLVVHSPYLLNALRAVVKYSSNPPFGDKDGTHDGKFHFPYQDLYHHKDELVAYKQSHDCRDRHSDEANKECDQHIDMLTDYLYAQPFIRLKDVEDSWLNKIPTTTFASLWLLMKPGTDVYV